MNTDAFDSLVFDIGGVLIGFDQDAVLKDQGMSQSDMDAFKNAFFGDPLWNEFDLENYTAMEVADMYIEKYPEWKDNILYFMEHADRIVVSWPKVYERLHELKQAGYKIYLLSNYSSYFLRKHVCGLPFWGDLDGFVISYQIHSVKPGDEIYQTLIRNYGLEPSKCIYFDDKQENVDGAARNGFNARLVTGQEQLLEMLSAY